jgi:hypothetical protein
MCACGFVRQGKLVGSMMRKHLAEQVIPLMCELRHMLQVRHTTEHRQQQGPRRLLEVLLQILQLLHV